MTQLNNAAGDGGLTVGVSSTGAFGSTTGATGASDARYDPIGTQGTGATTYQSDVAFRIGSTGARQFLSSLATNAVVGSSTSTVTNSSFIASGLKFELVQAVDDLKKDGQRTGSSLSQTYKITNPTSQTIGFELVRYFDGDLLFDGSLLDKGGKVTRNGQDILFETDSGDNASAPTTFVGITAKGGTDIALNRLEIGAFSSLRSRILSGTPLSDLIQGDTNGDSFIDGAAYDVTPAFRNVFEVAAGQSTTYVTETIFGSGAPNQVVLPQTISVAATDPIASENPGDPGTFTFTRTNSDLTQPLTVNYTLAGTATNGVDYTNLSNLVTFAAGQATTTVTVAPIDDTIVEPTESVILTLANGTGYNLAADLAKAQINITDNDVLLPSITIAAGINAAEPATNGTFTLARTGDLAAALTVNLAAPTGTATSGVDYTALAPTATFAVGSATATVTVATIDDTLVEPTETIGLALAAGAGYTLGTTTAATINLIDNDVAPHPEEQTHHCFNPEASVDNFNPDHFTALSDRDGYQIDWRDDTTETTANSPHFNDMVMRVEVLNNSATHADTYLEYQQQCEVMNFGSLAGENLEVEGWNIYAPFVPANGNFDDYLETDPQNQSISDINPYFSYLGANTDRIDNFQLLGDNNFGVDDLYGCGDRDYNNVAFQMTI